MRRLAWPLRKDDTHKSRNSPNFFEILRAGPWCSGFALQIGPCRFFLSAWAFCLLAERSSARLQADASPHKRISSLALLLFRPSNTSSGTLLLVLCSYILQRGGLICFTNFVPW
ncbi:hypothetical protein PVAP13_2KG574518 [Panicum virgatum]|uniref:Uncharacterized protein n=1 Tax=Panicum virgatum TaxID=38727 RepID=A0A8T0WCV9_PANVG|nr:hypothetical protein PVAP13_2KG574518 [Panicum virgatum]